MKTNKFYKIVSQDLKNVDLKIITKKMEEYSRSNYDSDSGLYTSVKQDIHRSKPQEKTARKKFTVDKDFRVKNPHIDSNTGNWIW